VRPGVSRWIALSFALLCLAASAGCSQRNPRWASSVNPCCGQDLILKGIEPPEDRCADIVLDQETARRLMSDIASGNGVTRWHVRFIPGGPACIWETYSGLTRDDYLQVDPPEEVLKEELEAVKADTGASAKDAGVEQESGDD
jgi:hypothetical protein